MRTKKGGFWEWFGNVHWVWKVLLIILIILAIVFIICIVFVIVYAIVGALAYTIGGGWVENIGKNNSQ